ncbi:MAG TPA: hypothetical protein DCF63_03205 [Planctomycetaceae bacterium]|nr:hypothetical protein [Planctomycetaceae bacterium]
MGIWLLAIFGCGGNDQKARLDQLYPDRQPVIPVSGTVLIDGQPGKELFLRLVPADDKEPSPVNPQTFTDAEGRFSFMTYLEDDGVPSGKYNLLVEKLQNQGASFWTGPDGLKNLYNHVDQPAERLEVKEPLRNLEIKLELVGKSAKRAPKYGVSRLGDR